MNRLITTILAAAIAMAACAQDLITRYPDNYNGDNQYYVARALDPLMTALGRYTSTELLRHERLDPVDAIGDRGFFTLSSGVVATPPRGSDGSLDLGARPRLSYEYSPIDELDCLEMIQFIANRYAQPEEPFEPYQVIEDGSVDLSVPTGTLRIEVTPYTCSFILFPHAPAEQKNHKLSQSFKTIL